MNIWTKLTKRKATDKKIITNSSTVTAIQEGWLGSLAKKSGLSLDALEQKNLVYLLIDCSSSMNGDKIEQAKNGAADFAKDAVEKGYLVGLIKFDSQAAHLSNPSDDLNYFNNQINEMMARDSTNMTDAIQIAIEKLVGKTGNRVICLVTDGAPNNPNSALAAAQLAKDAGIKIITIGTDDADKNFLALIATQKDLSLEVDSKKLGEGIKSMAKLLPKPKH